MLYFGNKWPCREATDENTAWFGIWHADGTVVEVAARFNHRVMFQHWCNTSFCLFQVKRGVNGAELWFGFFSKQLNINRGLFYRWLMVTNLEKLQARGKGGLDVPGSKDVCLTFVWIWEMQSICITEIMTHQIGAVLSEGLIYADQMI